MKKAKEPTVETCGTCKFFNAKLKENEGFIGSCAIKLPPKYRLADQMKNYLVADFNSCDLWKGK